MRKCILANLIGILVCVVLTGCINKNIGEINEVIVSEEESQTIPIETELPLKSPTFIEVNYSDCFQGLKGCAVFYNSDSCEYKLYNKEICQKQVSPCSTFKIISTLIGLENGVISSKDSKMGFNNTIYPIMTWNSDLTLKEAFQSSCVWYFKKVIDMVGQEKTKEILDELGYGNCDISEWDGSNINPLPDINGFWLESSLKISPQEQVEVLAKIFDSGTNFESKNIEITKEVMFVNKIGNISVFGKTGTGTNHAWFTGMVENGATRYYFVVHLENDRVCGKQAKEIARDIISKYYDD